MFSIISGELRLFELLLSLFALVCAVGTSLYAIREMKISRALITEKMPHLEDYIQKGEDGMITMREDVAMVIDAFGSRIAKSLKMSFLQGLGAEAKIEKGLKGAMAQDIIEKKMPLLNLAADFLGFNTKQYIAKHPDAIGQLAGLAAPYIKNLNLSALTGQGQPPQGNNGMGGYG